MRPSGEATSSLAATTRKAGHRRGARRPGEGAQREGSPAEGQGTGQAGGGGEGRGPQGCEAALTLPDLRELSAGTLIQPRLPTESIPGGGQGDEATDQGQEARDGADEAVRSDRAESR